MSATTLTFAAGSTMSCVSLTVHEDALVETEEIFEVHLSVAMAREAPPLLSVANFAEVTIVDMTGESFMIISTYHIIHASIV